MAKTQVLKLRQRKNKDGSPKVVKCCVCGEPLVVGEFYQKVWNYNATYEMHQLCYQKTPRSRWETSAYTGMVMDIIDEFDANSIENTLSQLYDLQSDLEEKLDNIPDQLKDAPTGTLLQERIDAVYDASEEIEGWRDEIEDLITNIQDKLEELNF